MKAMALLLGTLALARCIHVAGEPRSPLLIEAAAPAAKPAAAAPKPAAELKVPANFIARAKFHRSDPVLVDKLAFLNALVNHAIAPVPDPEHYGVGERFVAWPEDGKGDCEDYALSKIEWLGNAGYPLAGHVRFETVVVHYDAGGSYGHMIAELLLPSGEVMILDSNFDEPMTRAELVAQGYQFFDWRA